MQNETQEVMELSLEKVIDSKLIQGNVTQQIIAELTERYGGMKLRAIDDKESYLEIKAAAKECAKIRTLAVKLCKQGRDEAVKTQKAWVAKEKEVVGQVALVEDALDAEVSIFDNEVSRVQAEEKSRQEEAYINRQAQLTKMGATYTGGCFVLGEVSFEANLVKDSSEMIWTSSVLPAYEAEYTDREQVRIKAEAEKEAAAAELKRQQQELAQQQEDFRLQQAQAKADSDKRIAEEAQKSENDRRKKEAATFVLQKERFEKMLPVANYGERVDMNILFSYEADEFAELLASKTLAATTARAEQAIIADVQRGNDIEKAKQLAVKEEQDRVESEKIRKQTEMDAAGDKVKWLDFIRQVADVETYLMKSNHYKSKMQIARAKIEEILAI